MASRHRALLVVLVAFAISSGGGCGVRQDEFDCSNAVSHLAQCCSGFDPSTISCSYQENKGCTSTSPALDVDESDCIRAKSCEELQRSGACTRAMTAGNDGTTSVCNAYSAPLPTPIPPPLPPFSGGTTSSSGAPVASDDSSANDDASSAEAGEDAAPESGDAASPDAAGE